MRVMPILTTRINFRAVEPDPNDDKHIRTGIFNDTQKEIKDRFDRILTMDLIPYHKTIMTKDLTKRLLEENDETKQFIEQAQTKYLGKIEQQMSETDF